MSAETRQRLASLVRRPDADLAEAALLVCAEADPTLDIDLALLRIDAITDGLRSQDFSPEPARRAAEQLAGYLGGVHGFTGDTATYHDPDNALLTRVLERRRGLPITLSILYAAVGRRLRVPAYPIALPGHVVTGIANDDRPIVLDPFHAGSLLDEAALQRRVMVATGGRSSFRRSMLRPAPAALVIRRLLNNLVRDLTSAGRTRDAVWASELRLLLPNRIPQDHRSHGEVLLSVGRFDEAADCFETYLAVAGDDAPARDEARKSAIGARARLN